MTQQDDITQRVLTDHELDAIHAPMQNYAACNINIFTYIARAIESALLSKLRAEGVQAGEPFDAEVLAERLRDVAASHYETALGFGISRDNFERCATDAAKIAQDMASAPVAKPKRAPVDDGICWSSKEIQRRQKEEDEARAAYYHSRTSAPVAGEPFLYGIMGPDGKAHFEEFCVSGDRDELQAEVVDHLNRDNPEDGSYSVVALFRDAAPQASESDFTKLQSAYVGACDQIAELLAEKQASAEFIQAAIDRAPDPLRRLGVYLSRVLDEDQWPTAEKMLLGACDAAPQASAEVQPNAEIVALAREGVRVNKPDTPEYQICAELRRLARALKQPRAGQGERDE